VRLWRSCGVSSPTVRTLNRQYRPTPVHGLEGTLQKPPHSHRVAFHVLKIELFCCTTLTGGCMSSSDMQRRSIYVYMGTDATRAKLIDFLGFEGVMSFDDN
jgi:hypothetical protein